MMSRFLASSILLLVLTVTALADIARPNNNSSTKPVKVVMHAGLQVVPDAKAYEARLEIPQELWNQMHAGMTNLPANPTMAQRIAQSSPRTIIAGLFLFLSVSFAGVWLVRSGQRNQRIAAIIVLGAAILGAATIITRANAGPPGYIRWQNLPKNLNEGRPTVAGVDVVIVSEGDGIKLVMPIRKANSPAE